MHVTCDHIDKMTLPLLIKLVKKEAWKYLEVFNQNLFGWLSIVNNDSKRMNCQDDCRVEYAADLSTFICKRRVS